MLGVTKRVQIGIESSHGVGGIDGWGLGEVDGGDKNNLGLTEKEREPLKLMIWQTDSCLKDNFAEV